MSSLVAPRLRPSVNLEPILHEGRRSYALNDRLQVAKEGLVLSPHLAAALSFFDGTRTDEMISAAFTKHYGQTLPPDAISQLIGTLDDALLLDNERGRQAQQAALTHYRNETQRVPICAGCLGPAPTPAKQRLPHGQVGGAHQIGRTPRTRDDPAPHESRAS